MSISEMTPPRVRRWTREEYYKMGELGWFQDQRVELIRGRIYELPRQTPRQGVTRQLCAEMFQRLVEPAAHIRQRGPLDLGKYNDPEPDIAIVSGSNWDYAYAHPTTALMVIEVSPGFLDYYRKKAPLYARAGVPEYWIVNLPERTLITLCDPVESAPGSGEWTYARETVLTANGAATTRLAPDARIAVADLLP